MNIREILSFVHHRLPITLVHHLLPYKGRPTLELISMWKAKTITIFVALARNTTVDIVLDISANRWPDVLSTK